MEKIVQLASHQWREVLSGELFGHFPRHLERLCYLEECTIVQSLVHSIAGSETDFISKWMAHSSLGWITETKLIKPVFENGCQFTNVKLASV